MMLRNLAAGLLLSSGLTAAAAADYRARLPEDEVIYFLLPDRFENGDPKNDTGGLKGDRLKHGFDPTDPGFYHGGDLKGVTKRLDYLQGLGVTAIWLGPVYVNKAVQEWRPGDSSSAYHGYWITDFTRVDPHLGTDADYKALVDAAHARGMKVYQDIVVNHTANVIQYKECPVTAECGYRSKAGHPADPAYTPYLPKGEEQVKKPDWLNDPRFYHNRGNSTFEGESSTLGDFGGLDDVATEMPEVIDGFIKIYGDWIDRFGIDGYRIDTARHVNAELWQAFVPAILNRARAKGIPNFHIFGEVALRDIGVLAEHTRVHKLPAVLDFGFEDAVRETLSRNAGTDRFAHLWQLDALYEHGDATARILPTFFSNHDDGRFPGHARADNPKLGDDELLKRVMLANAIMFTTRGVPTVYSGDEQGFIGGRGDRANREDMFPSKVPSYNAVKLIGTAKTTADDNFDSSHPLYRQIAGLAKLRADHAALRRGSTVIRAAGKAPGLLAVSRFDPETGKEALLAFNTSGQKLDAKVAIDKASTGFTALAGACATPWAAGSVRVTLEPFAYAVCAAN